MHLKYHDFTIRFVFGPSIDFIRILYLQKKQAASAKALSRAKNVLLKKQNLQLFTQQGLQRAQRQQNVLAKRGLKLVSG